MYINVYKLNACVYINSIVLGRQTEKLSSIVLQSTEWVPEAEGVIRNS